MPIITTAHLKNEIAALNELRIKEIICSNHIYVHSMQVSRQAKSDTAFLNSFYLDDLNLLINSKDTFGKGLDNYLQTDVSQVSYTDLLTDASAFFQTIDPSKIPAGRWPSNPAHGLYTAQVGAVNTSLTLLKDNGIIGINGPPGTGKTTLLSDIISEVVVSRAQKLMQANISTLFSRSNRIEKENGFAYHFPVNSIVFDDVGIVVASNNNSAVENISKELPDVKKIDSGTFPEAGYFHDHAQNLIEGDSWGLLAAALGNAENRAIFKNNFWYKKENSPGFASFLQSLYNNSEDKDHTVDYIERYQKIKIELEAHLKEFDEFKKAATDFYRLLPGYLKDQQQKTEVEHIIDQLSEDIKTLSNSKNTLTGRLESFQKQIIEIQYSIQLHQSVKPGFFFFKSFSIPSPFEGGMNHI